MDRITCDIIRDLLPLYIDEVCSAAAGRGRGTSAKLPACKAEYEPFKRNLL